MLDTWQSSELPARDFDALVNMYLAAAGKQWQVLKDNFHFYLTSCQHYQHSPPPGFCSATFHASEAFAYESALTGNQEHRRIMREALRTAIAAGAKTLADKEALGQTGYYSGVFLFAPFGLGVLDEPPHARDR